MSTIFDVAKKSGVSIVTVSRLLNNPGIVSKRTAEKIYMVMDKLNYQPNQIARSMVSKRTNTIGVIMPDIKNTFFNSWFRFIEDYAATQGFNLVLCNTDEDPLKEIKYIKLLQSQRVDGIIIAPNSVKSADYLIKSGMRFILFDRVSRKTKTNFITSNHYEGAFKATEYLIGKGHRKIAVLKGPGILYPDIERYSGFENAMKKHSIEIKKPFVLNCEFKEDKAYAAALELLSKKEKPTAVFPFNSLMTIGVIKAVQKLKLKMPGNISLLSFDEIPGHEIFLPKITHVIQPIEMLGKEVITALVEMIKNPGSKKRTRIVLKPELVIGGSCKTLK
ncbi:MAG: LacI family DNA-binding transcriptional regulator [Ignavibacteriaceae bacterium]